MGINGSKVDFKDPNVVYDETGIDDPDGIGRIVIFRDQGYDTGYDTQPVTGHDAKTRGEKGPVKVVQLYSKSDLNGEIFEVDYGNYTSDVLMPTMVPSNVFSLTIPPRTTIKLYCGNEYDFGGKGGMSITNTSPDVMKVRSLPSNIAGQIRSISVISHSITRAGEIADEESDEGEDQAVITSDRGDVIAAGLMPDQVQPSASHDTTLTNVEPYKNLADIILYPETVVVFYLFLLIAIVYLMSETKTSR